MGALSNGRVGLTFYANCFMTASLSIALRYAAVRKQFGASPGHELPILEYQLHVKKKISLCLLKLLIKNLNF